MNRSGIIRRMKSSRYRTPGNNFKLSEAGNLAGLAHQRIRRQDCLRHRG